MIAYTDRFAPTTEWMKGLNSRPKEDYDSLSEERKALYDCKDQIEKLLIKLGTLQQDMLKTKEDLKNTTQQTLEEDKENLVERTYYRRLYI
jgi:hypothetical protein